MPKTSKEPGRGPNAGKDTTDYSATKAPENREHVESKTTSADPSARPGGVLGVPVDVGMSGLDRATVPSLAADEEDAAGEPDEVATSAKRHGSGPE